MTIIKLSAFTPSVCSSAALQLFASVTHSGGSIRVECSSLLTSQWPCDVISNVTPLSCSEFSSVSDQGPANDRTLPASHFVINL